MGAVRLIGWMQKEGVQIMQIWALSGAQVDATKYLSPHLGLRQRGRPLIGERVLTTAKGVATNR